MAALVVSRCPEPHEDTATLQANVIAVMSIVATTDGTRESDCEVQLFEVMGRHHNNSSSMHPRASVVESLAAFASANGYEFTTCQPVESTADRIRLRRPHGPARSPPSRRSGRDHAGRRERPDDGAADEMRGGQGIRDRDRPSRSARQRDSLRLSTRPVETGPMRRRVRPVSWHVDRRPRSRAGFDPSSIPSPIVGQNVFSHHGRGIYLINQLMDEVTFAHGGTEIRMRAK